MAGKILLDGLYQQLFGDPSVQVYGVFDGASAPGLPAILEQQSVDHVCLYRGQLVPELAAAAPYLALLERDAEFTNHVLQQGWGNHWGIFVHSKADLRILRHHFRTFTMVYGPDGNPLYFRYYDPRVLRVYLPTCNAQDMNLLFGPVSRYLAEGEDPATLWRFWAEAERPGSEQIRLPQKEESIS